MREKLLNYLRNFFKESRNSASSGAYAFGSEHDPIKAYELAKILKRHQIEVHKVDKDFTEAGLKFKKGNSYVVPKDQRQHRLLKAMFERRTEFQDSLFYDISAWTFPLAFNLDFSEDVAMKNAGEKIQELEIPTPEQPEKSSYAYLLDWQNYLAPKALNMILEKGLRAKVFMEAFTFEGNEFAS